MAVRSLSIARGSTSSNALNQVYVVPAGFTTIVKGLLCFSRAAAPSTIDLALRIAAGGLDLPLVYTSLSPNTQAHFDFWVVMEQGDSLWFTGGAAGVDYAISGATLPNVP